MGDYYKTKETVEEYIRLAEGFDGQYLIDKIIPFLKPTSSILELGSGPGKDWEILSKSYVVTGSDNSPKFIQYLKQKHPNGEFIELDASRLQTDKKFHAIYSNKVLHHLKDDELEISINRQYEILHPGGVIIHSFWKGKDSEVFKGLFVNYHLEQDLEKLFGEYFKILHIESYKEFEEGDSIILIGKKKEL